MNTDTWRKIDGCLAEALELPPSQRRDFLVSKLGSDTEAAREACKLAECAESAERLFAHSPVTKYTGLSAGSRIGPWELIKPLGSGGMGVVWMARRVDGQATMLAAIKLLPPAFVYKDAELEQRFLVEKQILARLHHPNIARLLDAGAGGGETPNFVMEYVDGEPLLDYLATHPITAEAKLRLFLKICDAVQYAHGNLTIHRDLKPHNILVPPNGEPKLLDFGIGKILNESAGGGTITLHRAFSIDYASPEQLRGGTISTSTDIYSLGLILFETITGERARRWNDKALGEVLDLSERFTLPDHPSVSRDLAAVMRKATVADSELRYRTVSELAADVERVLDGRPVEARPAGVFYQLTCFARRNKLAMAASSMALLAIVGLGSWGLLSAQQARKERAVALEKSELLQAALLREQAALNNEIAARQTADVQRKQAQEQAELARKFASLAQSREQQAEDRLRSMLRIFDSSIYSAREDVSKLPGGTKMGIQLIERTLAQLRDVKPSDAGRPDYLAVQADAHSFLAELYGGANSNLGKGDLSLVHRNKAVELWREVNHLARGRIGWERSYLAARFILSRESRFDPADSKSPWWNFEREYLSLLNREPQNTKILRDIGSYYFWRSRRFLKPDRQSLYNDLQKSLQYFTRTLDEAKPNPTALRDVALGHKYVAGYGDSKDGLYHASEALRLDRMRVALDPSDASAKVDMAFSTVSVADARRILGEDAVAQKGYLEGFKMRKALAHADPENVFVSRSLAYPIRFYGYQSIQLKDWTALQEAVTELTWAASRQRAEAEPDPLIALDIAHWRALLAEQSGDPANSCTHYREAARLAASPALKTTYYAAGAIATRLATCPAQQ